MNKVGILFLCIAMASCQVQTEVAQPVSAVKQTSGRAAVKKPTDPASAVRQATAIKKPTLPAIDLTKLNPRKYDPNIFEHPMLEDGLIFWNKTDISRVSKRYKAQNAADEKGFFIEVKKEWKRHGEWLSFESNILRKRTFFTKGKKDESQQEVSYDSFGAIVSTTYVRRRNKKEYFYEKYDADLNISIDCKRPGACGPRPVRTSELERRNAENETYQARVGEMREEKTSHFSREQFKAVIDGAIWSNPNGKFKAVKNKTTYGILKQIGGVWTRTGRWYFFEGGKARRSTAFLAGKKNNTEYLYTAYGFLSEQSSYKSGVKHGRSAQYLPNGDVSEMQCYIEGQTVDCPPKGCFTDSAYAGPPRVIIENQ